MIKFIELFAGVGGFRYGLENITEPQGEGRTRGTQCLRSEGDSSNGQTQSREGDYGVGVEPTNEESRQTKPQVQQTKPQVQQRGVGALVEVEPGVYCANSRRVGSVYRCVWANEIDKYACQVYRRNYGKRELHEGDIRSVQSNTLPDFEMLVGGFPCQSFSMAGKRRGMSGEDTRGTLFYEIYRIARDRQPRLLLLENVPGLLSSGGGKDFQTILQSLDEIGYDVQWDCLNSKNYGVPQSRERVFIVGHLRGTGTKQIFPIRENGEGDNEVGVQGASASAGEGEVCDPEDRGRCAVHPCLTPARETKRQHGRRFKSNGEPSFTLTGMDQHGVLLDAGLPVIRRLTPVECERLQGFPDGWTDCVSDTQRYKCCGNAVTTNVISAIGRKLCI